jgi:peptide/nickel transport system ATP-binding protein
MNQVEQAAFITVDRLKVQFERRVAWGQPKQAVHAVDDVSFTVEKAKTLAIVGESGSGKTTTALSLMRLGPITSGAITMDGQALSDLKGEGLRQFRRHMQMVFQDPYSSLNPRWRVADIIRAPLDVLEIGTAAERADRVMHLMTEVGLRPDQRDLYPHQFSGGQRQRINIARALAPQPSLVVCDEPVSALDVAVRAQTLNLLKRLQQQFGLTYVFISHDMSVVHYMADTVVVMLMGKIVERADRETFFKSPRHPYSKALLASVPSIKNAGVRPVSRIRVTGEPASPINPQPGCRFASRCPNVETRCRHETPSLLAINPLHEVACHLVPSTL